MQRWLRGQWLADLRVIWDYELPKRRDLLLLDVAWLLPRRLVTWCFVRVVAHATTGEHGGTLVPELTAADALQRWEQPAEGPRP